MQRSRQELYLSLNDSPMIRRLREEYYSFAAVVYWKPGDYDRQALLYEFKRIKQVGFDAVRMHSSKPVELEPGRIDFNRSNDWIETAAEAGLKAILHFSFSKASDAAIAKHGLTREHFEYSDWSDPRCAAILEEYIAPVVSHYAKHPAVMAWAIQGEPGSANQSLTEALDAAPFAAWLKARYGSLEVLERHWNLYPEKSNPSIRSFEDAWRVGSDNPRAKEGALSTVAYDRKSYGPTRDVMRYQTEKSMKRNRLEIALIRKYDSIHPIGVGCHQLMFNQPSLRWDIGEHARIADFHYSSIHLSWHFAPVKGELDRAIYMQARMTRDYFKGGLTSAYETTGGAVQNSGGYGNSMTPGLMRRMMLSYLAAGNKSVAFWSWNARPGGIEAGEYGMITLSGEIADWTWEAGKVIKAMHAHKQELWDGDHMPRVGLLQSWDTDAIYCLEPKRFDLQDAVDDFSRGTKMQAQRAYIGVARACINNNVPYEYLTSQELLEGIGCIPKIS